MHQEAHVAGDLVCFSLVVLYVFQEYVSLVLNMEKSSASWRLLRLDEA